MERQELLPSFIEPSSFDFLSYQKNTIHGMYLLWETKKISSTDINFLKMASLFLLDFFI
jgi:hypothetical protein